MFEQLDKKGKGDFILVSPPPYNDREKVGRRGREGGREKPQSW